MDVCSQFGRVIDHNPEKLIFRQGKFFMSNTVQNQRHLLYLAICIALFTALVILLLSAVQHSTLEQSDSTLATDLSQMEVETEPHDAAEPLTPEEQEVLEDFLQEAVNPLNADEPLVPR